MLRHFGSWNQALRAAGLPRFQYRGRQLTDDQLLQEVRQLTAGKDRLTITDYEQLKPGHLPGYKGIIKRFHSWEAFTDQLQLAPNYFRATTKNLLRNFRTVYEQLNRIPSAAELEEYGSHCIENYCRHFGNYNQFLELLGLPPHAPTPGKVEASNQQLIARYRDFSAKIGATGGATTSQLNAAPGIHKAHVFLTRFGTIEALRRQAGYPPGRSRRQLYDKQQLRQILLEAYRQKGRRLLVRELEELDGLPPVNTLLRYFQVTGIRKLWDKLVM